MITMCNFPMISQGFGTHLLLVLLMWQHAYYDAS